VGHSALGATTTGSQNTAVGALSLDANTTGAANVAFGVGALGGNTTASNNTALGYAALNANTTGYNNTSVGTSALQSNTEGNFNVCLGVSAGTNNTTGIRNTFIGTDCRGTSATTNDAIGIGYDIQAAGDYTTIGRSALDIRAAHGTASWATVSDERFKKDILDSTTGLNFVNALRPRTFKYKNLGELPNTFNAYKEGSTEVFKNSNTNHGFIAQEVKAAIDADSTIKDGFKLWDDREDGSQEVAEAALIPVLVKAIQELSAKNEALLTRIEALEG
jgi:hypothetical protein